MFNFLIYIVYFYLKYNLILKEENEFLIVFLYVFYL